MISDMLFFWLFTASGSAQSPDLQEDQCPQCILFLQWLGAMKKVTMNLIKADFFWVLVKTVELEDSPSTCTEKITLSTKNEMQTRFQTRPALGILCQSGHLRCAVKKKKKWRQARPREMLLIAMHMCVHTGTYHKRPDHTPSCTYRW